jgi:hypothetical protein
MERLGTCCIPLSLVFNLFAFMQVVGLGHYFWWLALRRNDKYGLHSIAQTGRRPCGVLRRPTLANDLLFLWAP